MKRISHLAAFLIAMAFVICAAPAKAQAFLDSAPAPATPPSFLEPGAVGTGMQALATGGAQGNQNNISNLLTGPGAYKAGVIGSRYLNVQSTQQALLAPGSVNMAPISSYSNDGFTGTGGATYAGRALPLVSTGSCNINVVDCANLAENYGAGQTNPWAFVDNLIITNADGTQRAIDFQQTSESAASFLQNQLQLASPEFGSQ